MMKAAYIKELGSAENICYGDFPVPSINDWEILVRVNAVAVDPVDTYIRSGAYKTSIPLPFIIGRDMVGIVEKVGRHVGNFKVGDRVWANNQGYSGRQGTFAEFISVNEDLLYHLPDAADEIQSVAVLHSALTAVTGLFGRAKIKAGETLFINGGSGNVGIAALQVAKAARARVAVTAGSEEKIAWCKENGADLVIDYKRENIADALKNFAADGVDVYWDATKRPNLELAMSVIARRGRVLLMSGLAHRAELPIGIFYTKNCTLYGFTISDLSVEELAEASTQINNGLKKGIFRSKIFAEMPLSKAAEAQKLMEQGDVFGKVILKP